MPEPIDWLPDGTPYSPRFGDRYHSENGGLTQARCVFLQGCGLPAAWAGLPQWRILETGFGFGLNFLVTWAAWRADPHRPAMLHFVSTEAWPVSAADLLRVVGAHPELSELAHALHAQWWGLLPGVHRLQFEEGRVLLTLYIGDTQTQLRQQNLTVDAVYLDGFSPQRNPDIWDLHTLKAVARCCRRGTRLATWTISRRVRDSLTQCGFEVQRVPGVPPKRDNLHAVYNPRWEPRGPRGAAPGDTAQHPETCIVIGGGIAGASAAASLARRGCRVQVLDRASEPGRGASALPAGVFAPHVSPDDSVLSRLSRSGVRITLEQARWWLHEGADWCLSGVLEHRPDGARGLPALWLDGPGADWCEPASADTLAKAGLASDAPGCWHRQAGWLRPARLAQALLGQPRIDWKGGHSVAALRPAPADTDGAPRLWQALDAQGGMLAEASTVVIAAGAGSLELLGQRWPLRKVRGQVSLGAHGASDAPVVPFPVNGNGNLVPDFSLQGDGTARAWVMGSTFERDVDVLPPSVGDVRAGHAANFAKLQALLPQTAAQLAGVFQPARDGVSGALQSWAAVRCTSPDRLPIAGPVNPVDLPGVWACTAMGARGLTMALLCGELLAAQLYGEPLPLDARLAKALGTERLGPS